MSSRCSCMPLACAARRPKASACFAAAGAVAGGHVGGGPPTAGRVGASAAGGRRRRAPQASQRELAAHRPGDARRAPAPGKRGREAKLHLCRNISATSEARGGPPAWFLRLPPLPSLQQPIHSRTAFLPGGAVHKQLTWSSTCKAPNAQVAGPAKSPTLQPRCPEPPAPAPPLPASHINPATRNRRRSLAPRPAAPRRQHATRRSARQQEQQQRLQLAAATTAAGVMAAKKPDVLAVISTSSMSTWKTATGRCEPTPGQAPDHQVLGEGVGLSHTTF